MSLLAVRSAPFLLSDYCSSIRSVSVASSLSDFASSFDLSSSDTLNLEDIKIQLSQCCSTCGVCWKDEHFSFDCTECGGYSMIRPCLNCGGNCGALWTRDFALVSCFKSFSINIDLGSQSFKEIWMEVGVFGRVGKIARERPENHDQDTFYSDPLSLSRAEDFFTSLLDREQLEQLLKLKVKTREVLQKL